VIPRVAIVVACAAALSGAAGAQSPRYRATLVSNSIDQASINNNNEVLFTTGYGATGTIGSYVRRTDGTLVAAPFFGVFNDLGDVLYNTSTGFKSKNIYTGVITSYTMIPDSLNRFVLGISNSGWVVGGGTYSSTVGYMWAAPTNPQYLSYGGFIGVSPSINNQDDVIFYALNEGKSVLRRASGEQVVLGAFGSTGGAADMSDNGLILGQTSDVFANGENLILGANLQVQHRFRNPVEFDIASFGHVNSHAEVVGGAARGNSNATRVREALYWSPMTGTLYLSDLVENLPSGVRLSSATGISDSRGIVAHRSIYDPETGLTRKELYYLHPVPEPATMAGLGVGVLALLRRRKQK
jgi:hypothetical protein